MIAVDTFGSSSFCNGGFVAGWQILGICREGGDVEHFLGESAVSNVGVIDAKE
jgi:hypothetical protein